MATYDDGSRHLVVASGGNNPATSRSFIYDLDSGVDAWRPGPPLPVTVGTSVPFKVRLIFSFKHTVGSETSCM